MNVFPGEICDVFAVDADLTTVQLIEPHEEIHQGGLACAGGTYNGHLLAGFGVGGEVVDDGFLRGIAEADMGEFHIALHRFHRQNLRLVGFIGQLLLVQEVKDPLGGGGGGLKTGGRLGNLGQGIGELPHIDHEGHNGAEVGVSALDQHGAHDAHRHIAQVAHEAHEGLHETGEELRLPGAVVQIAVDLIEGILGGLLAVVGFDHVMSGVDFFDMPIELAQILLLSHEVLLGFPDDQHHEAEAQDGGDDGGDGHDAVGNEHHEQRAQEHGDGGHQIAQGLVHGLTDGVYVIGHPAEHVTEAHLVVIAQGNLVDFPGDTLAQGLGDPLGESGHEVMLNIVADGSQTVQNYQGDACAEDGVHVDLPHKTLLDQVGHVPQFIGTHQGENRGHHGQNHAGDADGQPGPGKGQKLAPGAFQVHRLGGKMGFQMRVMHVPIPPLTAGTGQSGGKPRRISAALGGYPGRPLCHRPGPGSGPHPGWCRCAGPR